MKEKENSTMETLRMFLWTAMVLIPILAMGIMNTFTELSKNQEDFNFLVVCFIFLNLLGIFSIKKMGKYPMLKKIIIKQDNKKIIFIIFFTILFIMMFLAIVSLLILLLINEPQTIDFEINVLKLIVCTLFYGVFYQKLKKFLVKG